RRAPRAPPAPRPHQEPRLPLRRFAAVSESGLAALADRAAGLPHPLLGRLVRRGRTRFPPVRVTPPAYGEVNGDDGGGLGWPADTPFVANLGGCDGRIHRSRSPHRSVR